MENTTFKYKTKKINKNYTDYTKTFDELKFVHILEGSAIWSIDGKDFFVEPDDIVVFCRHNKRYIKSILSAEELFFEQIVFQPITISYAHHCSVFFYNKKAGFLNVLPRDNPYHAMILDDFAAIRRENAGAAPWCREYIANRIGSIVILASRILFPKDEINSMKNSQYETVCRAISYINENLGGDLSRDAIASKLYVSASHLSKIFKMYSGICLQEYIVRARVQKAATLIGNHVRILDAADEAGFKSVSGFYRAFSDVTGKKPTDLLKNN